MPFNLSGLKASFDKMLWQSRPCGLSEFDICIARVNSRSCQFSMVCTTRLSKPFGPLYRLILNPSLLSVSYCGRFLVLFIMANHVWIKFETLLKSRSVNEY